KDRHSALVQFDIKGEPEDAVDKIDPVVAAVEKTADRHDALAIEQFGGASSEKQLTERIQKEGQQGQILSLGLTLLILFFTFGALIAASVPVVLALTAVAGTSGLLGIASQFLPI